MKKSSLMLIRNMITWSIVVATVQKWGDVAYATTHAIAIAINIQSIPSPKFRTPSNEELIDQH